MANAILLGQEKSGMINISACGNKYHSRLGQILTAKQGSPTPSIESHQLSSIISQGLIAEAQRSCREDNSDINNCTSFQDYIYIPIVRRSLNSNDNNNIRVFRYISLAQLKTILQ